MWDRFTRSTDALGRRPVRRPLVWCALAAAAGTLLGFALPGRLAWLPLAAAAAMLPLALWTRPKGTLLAMTAALAALLLFMGRAASVYERPAPPAGAYTVEGIVRQRAHVRENGRHVSVHLRDVVLTDESGGRRLADGLYWTAYVQEGYLLPEPGSRVRLYGRLYEPDGQRNPYGFDFRMYLRQNHMSAGLYNGGDYTVLEEAPRSLRSALIRLRYALLDRLDSAFGERSALPKALLLGERQALSERDREAFARLGIAHVLAVSGLHISLIVAAIGLIVRRLMPGKKQLWFFGTFLLLYAMLLEFRASVVRASVLTFVYLFVKARGRSGDPLSALALAFMLIVALSPLEITSAGFLLSFAAAGGIVLLYRPVYRRVSRFLGRRAGGLLASTVSAVAGTALPSVQTFHCFSVAGFVFSPVVCALLAYLLPLCLAVQVLSLVWMDAARWLAWPVGWALQLMSDGIAAAAQWPYMSLNCPAIPWPFYPLAAALIWLCSAYAPSAWKGKRRALILAALFAAGSTLHLCTMDRGVSYLQLDVGSADCAVVQDGRHTTVVDCGEDGRDLCAYLLATGRRADVLVLTHLHADHCLGAQALMDNRSPIGRLVIPEGAERAAVSEDMLLLLARLKEYCGVTEHMSAGDGWETPRTAARVLWPEPGGVRSARDANDYCLCLEYRLEDVTMLLTGDLTGTYEPYVHARADVLKVAHHGSRFSSTPDFLAEVSPKTAIISVSANAEAAKPDSTVRRRLADAGTEVYTTAACGAVRVVPERGGYRVMRFIKEGTR